MINRCPTCGVAFDVGYKYCREVGCPDSGRKIIKKNKKKYVTKKVPHYITRWRSTRYRARIKGIGFSLTIEFVKDVMESPCIYCEADEGYSELDRKDSSVGYHETNVVPACRRCNTIKNKTVTYEEMMFIAGYLGWRSND